jgi:hypothetical protein
MIDNVIIRYARRVAARLRNTASPILLRVALDLVKQTEATRDRKGA